MDFQNNGIFGFDVAFYEDAPDTPQGIDFVKMKNYGASFVGIKVGQDYYSDPTFSTNWTNAKLAGLPRLGYWFGDYDSSGQSQALKFWNLIKNDLGEGPLFVDYEDRSWTNWNELYNFISEFQSLSGLPNNRIGIYTGGYWLDHRPTNSTQLNWFSQFPLWLAWYTSNAANVVVPAPWTQCLLWQDGTPSIGLDVGVESREVDHNIFNGDANKFSSIFRAVPPTGDTMILYYADLKSGLNSNVRNTANGTLKTYITGPVTVNIISEKTVAGGFDWYEISSPVSGFIALTGSYENFRPATPPVLTEDKPVKITVEMESGRKYVSTDFTLL